MVHALKKVHSLLKPGGMMIDIHPTGEPPAFEVHIDGRVTRAGLYQETDDFVEYFQADDALAEVVREGLFVVERAGTFRYLTHADTIFELRDYVLAEWSDAIVDEEVVRRAAELFEAPGREKDVVLHEKVHIARLRRG